MTVKPNAAANTSFSKLCSTSSFPLNKTLFGLCKTTKSPLAVTIIIKNNIKYNKNILILQIN